ncbi:MAG: radical SAM protein [Clostridia bacterium]|nr:radical SAM protein [Clostridia bacterium]
MKKIYIEITNSCNLNCKFCHNTNRKKEFMPVKNFEEIIVKIKDYTKIVCLHVKGEPLLHPQLEKILQVLEKYNLKANITTNAVCLNKNIEVLKNSKVVRQLNLSLHSSLENENMDIEMYMKNIFDSVDVLEETNIIISYRLWNLESLENNEENSKVIKLLSDKYGINQLNELLTKNKWLELKDKIFINQDTKFIWPNLNSEIINQEGRCLAIKDQIAILVNGDVVPCCIDSEGEIILGNIYIQDIQTILNSARAKKILESFQKRIISEDLCKRCGFLNRLENKRK